MDFVYSEDVRLTCRLSSGARTKRPQHYRGPFLNVTSSRVDTYIYRLFNDELTGRADFWVLRFPRDAALSRQGRSSYAEANC